MFLQKFKILIQRKQYKVKFFKNLNKGKSAYVTNTTINKSKYDKIENIQNVDFDWNANIRFKVNN